MTERGPEQVKGVLDTLAGLWNEAQQGGGELVRQAQQQIQQKERDAANWAQQGERQASNWVQQQEAAAHQAYSNMVAAGQNLVGGARPTPPGPSRRPAASASPGQPRHWYDNNRAVYSVVDPTVSALGWAPGAARGAYHAAEGLYFLGRLADPLDPWLHPDGEAAWDDVARATPGVIDYVRKGAANPGMVARDLADQAHQFVVMNDLDASAPAPTLKEEARRAWNVGKNQGETGFNVGTSFLGGEGAAGFGGLKSAAEAGITAENAARNAEYFALPYRGMGHHYIPRRTALPGFLGGGPVPRWISDSPFFLLKPEMTNGDFFRFHYQVDPHYHGGRIPKRYGGGGWSGKDLGWSKDDLPARLWNGAPPPLKATVGGAATAGTLGAANLADQVYDPDQIDDINRIYNPMYDQEQPN